MREKKNKGKRENSFNDIHSTTIARVDWSRVDNRILNAVRVLPPEHTFHHPVLLLPAASLVYATRHVLWLTNYFWRISKEICV